MEGEREAHTPEEVNMAYRTAGKIAKFFVTNMRKQTLMDYEDFVQEGVLAWLEGRSMYHSMFNAYKAAGKLSPYAYRVKKSVDPVQVSFDETINGYEPTDSHEEDVVNKMDVERILNRISEIKDEDAQFIVMGSLYFGISLREIGTILGTSHETVRKVRDLHVNKIREEFQCQR